jgi:hypothetical protein
MLPIGLYVYFGKEKKDKKTYQSVFDDFEQKTLNRKNLNNQEKIELFEQMLEQNGYKVVSVTETSVKAQKKILSLGLMMIGVGIYIVGLLLYLLYYFYFQKPHEIVFQL